MSDDELNHQASSNSLLSSFVSTDDLTAPFISLNVLTVSLRGSINIREPHCLPPRPQNDQTLQLHRSVLGPGQQTLHSSQPEPQPLAQVQQVLHPPPLPSPGHQALYPPLQVPLPTQPTPQNEAVLRGRARGQSFVPVVPDSFFDGSIQPPALPCLEVSNTDSQEVPVRAELPSLVLQGTPGIVSLPTTGPDSGPGSSRHELVTSATSSLPHQSVSRGNSAPGSHANSATDHSPRYESLEWRRSTFRGRWHDIVPFLSEDVLAEAGFYYTGHEDFVRCYKCGGGLGQWQPGDDPLVEHYKHFNGLC